MRALLLLSALGAAQAQLMGYAAGSMQGHTTTPCIVKKHVKAQTGAYVQSSPTVGADGTVYVGSDDFYLHALNADGSLK